MNTHLKASIEKLSSKIDKTTARAITLDGEASDNQAELAKLTKQPLEMDTIRGNERVTSLPRRRPTSSRELQEFRKL